MKRAVAKSVPLLAKAEAPTDVEETSPLSERKRPWLEYMARRGLKLSRAREQIVEAFLEMQSHVDLEEILARVRERHPQTSPATVYRTVKLLEEAGIAHSRHFGDRHTVYEVAVGRAHHDHLICEHCGQIAEFNEPEIERLQDDVARAHGFVLLHHRHELFGLCGACRRAGGAAPVGGRPVR